MKNVQINILIFVLFKSKIFGKIVTPCALANGFKNYQAKFNKRIDAHDQVQIVDR